MSLQNNVRKKILAIAHKSKEGHIASSYSIVEILISIYKYLEGRRSESQFCKKLILSKGHAVFALYGLMHEVGLLTAEDLAGICEFGSYLIGHVPVKPEKNFFIGTGSLGHGFPMALGLAYAGIHKGDEIPYFVVIGDGELNEGSCWETLLLMQKFPNLNLRVFLDNNLSSNRAIPLENALTAIKSAWKTFEVDGHSVHQILDTLSNNQGKENIIIICNTQKGFPLKKMIDNPIWHHRSISDGELIEFNFELEQYFGG